MVPGVAGELARKMTGCAPGPWGQHCCVGAKAGNGAADNLAICCCMTFSTRSKKLLKAPECNIDTEIESPAH